MIRAVAWNAAKLAMLKKQYEAARAARVGYFEFVERESDKPLSPVIGLHLMFMDSAYHLIQYLEKVFKDNPTPPAVENREGKEGQ